MKAQHGVCSKGHLPELWLPIALKSLMKVLYAASVARPDLRRATCMMARRVTKWDADCDRRLHRIMCYINCTKDLVQKS